MKEKNNLFSRAKNHNWTNSTMHRCSGECGECRCQIRFLTFQRTIARHFMLAGTVFRPKQREETLRAKKGKRKRYHRKKLFDHRQNLPKDLHGITLLRVEASIFHRSEYVGFELVGSWRSHSIGITTGIAMSCKESLSEAVNHFYDTM